MIDRYLSIWEIAHRWREYNPDTSDPACPPFDVQDAIRYICRGVLCGEIHLLETVYTNSKDEDNKTRFELQQFWVSSPPAAIENCLYRKYDKETLSSHFIECENFFDYCLDEQSKRGTGISVQLDFSDFWWPLINVGNSHSEDFENDESPQIQLEPSNLRPSAIHKLICQAIAKTIWDIHPEITIAAMTEHKAILEHGSGKYYTGKNTLRDWLSEVAPENVKKPGRPKSNKPNNSAA